MLFAIAAVLVAQCNAVEDPDRGVPLGFSDVHVTSAPAGGVWWTDNNETDASESGEGEGEGALASCGPLSWSSDDAQHETPEVVRHGRRLMAVRVPPGAAPGTTFTPFVACGNETTQGETLTVATGAPVADAAPAIGDVTTKKVTDVDRPCDPLAPVGHHEDLGVAVTAAANERLAVDAWLVDAGAPQPNENDKTRIAELLPFALERGIAPLSLANPNAGQDVRLRIVDMETAATSSIKVIALGGCGATSPPDSLLLWAGLAPLALMRRGRRALVVVALAFPAFTAIVVATSPACFGGEGECVLDEDCGSDQICDRESGTCEGRCHQDRDCGDRQVCDLDHGTCAAEGEGEGEGGQ